MYRRSQAANFLEKAVSASNKSRLLKNLQTGLVITITTCINPLQIHALENVIKALRPHANGNIVVVFGCGGNRDAGKRPIMGKIANDLADVVYVTDDNPRFENAEEIRNQILAACPKATKTCCTAIWIPNKPDTAI